MKLLRWKLLVAAWVLFSQVTAPDLLTFRYGLEGLALPTG